MSSHDAKLRAMPVLVAVGVRHATLPMTLGAQCRTVGFACSHGVLSFLVTDEILAAFAEAMSNSLDNDAVSRDIVVHIGEPTAHAACLADGEVYKATKLNNETRPPPARRHYARCCKESDGVRCALESGHPDACDPYPWRALK